MYIVSLVSFILTLIFSGKPAELYLISKNSLYILQCTGKDMFSLLCRTMLLLIEMMVKDACADNEDYPKHLPVWIQSSTLLAGVWAFGGPLTPESREQFDIFFRDIWRGN